MTNPEFGPGGDRSPTGEDSGRRPAPPGVAKEVREEKRLRDLFFFAVLLVLFLEVLRQAPSFTGVARITPLFLGSLGSLFAAVGTVVTIVSLARGRSRAHRSGTAVERPSLGERIAGSWARPEVRAVVIAWLWLAGFAGTIWALGFVVGGALFGVVYLRASGKGWIATVLTVGVPLVLFARVIPSYLVVRIYEGVLIGRFL